MKRIVLTLMLALGLLATASAQSGEDFATRFVALHKTEYPDMICGTVSPNMMERIMLLDTLEENEDLKGLLSQVKSIQIVRNGQTAATDSLFAKASRLARLNRNRYHPYKNDKEREIYLRKHKQTIIEMVFISKKQGMFCIVNLTGEMNRKFLDQLENANIVEKTQ